MYERRKRKAAVITIVLIVTLLITDLPGLIRAEEPIQMNEQEEMLEVEEEEFSEEQDAGQDKTEENEDVTGIPAVDKNDPMYWMGQRTGGDPNRAMVWFGNYWQDAAASQKSPVLWRTLRSDGEGNYDGAVTLLSEYVLNSIVYTEDKYSNCSWCATNNRSSDLRAWLNGVGTGGMDAEADFPGDPDTRYDKKYNEAGGGFNHIRGSFYINAFDNTEKNFIEYTNIKRPYASRNTWSEVSDKVFALDGSKDRVDKSDVENNNYFKNDNDRVAYISDFAADENNTVMKRSSELSGKKSTWWLRSPVRELDQGHISCVSAHGLLAEVYMAHSFWTGVRPSVNLDPSAIIFTSASSYGGAPEVLENGSGPVSLELSTGVSAGTFETDENCSPVYGQGASYRIFSRSSEDSGILIEEGSSAGLIKIKYPSGIMGQYINVLVVADDGTKWTGRVKKVINGNSGNVEIAVPQINPGTSSERQIKVFAWREKEETRTAYAPKTVDLTIMEAESNRVTYNDGTGKDGATSMSFQSVAKGSKCMLHPCTFKKSGENFLGWLGNDGNIYSDKEIIKPEEDLILTAIWSGSSSTITYQPGEGTGDAIEVKVSTGGPATVRAKGFNPPEGKEFYEWNTAENGTGTAYKPGSIITVNEDITLFAQYTTTGTITYKGNGANEEDIIQEMTIGSEFQLKSDGFTKTGYKLAGWNTEADQSGTSYELGEKVQMAGSCTLYAQWEPITYKISFDGNGHNKGIVPEDMLVPEEGSDPIPDTELYKNHYMFDGWATSRDGSGTIYKAGDSITVDESFSGETLVLYAKWKDAQKYTLSYLRNEPAGISDSDLGGELPKDDESCYNDGLNTETTTAETDIKIRGYVFKGWSKNALTPSLSDEVIAPGSKITVTADMTLYAVWSKAEKWEVTYTGTTEGITGDFPKDEESYYDDGFTYKAVIEANPQTRPGYTFLGWSRTRESETAEIKPGDEITVDGNITLYSVWKAEIYTVKYDRNATGGNGDPPAEQSGLYGQKYTVSEAPEDMKNPGSKFLEWNTEADGTGDTYSPGETKSFAADLTLFAIWNSVSYKLTYYPNASDTTAPAPDYAIGSQINKIKIAGQGSMFRSHYKFAGWNTEADGSGRLIQPGEEIALTEDQSLYAVWKQLNPASITYHSGCSDALVAPTLPLDEKEYYDDGINNKAVIPHIKPLRRGYNFIYWSTQSGGAGTKYYGGEEISMIGSLKLYASWVAGSYILSYDKNGSDVTGRVPDSQRVSSQDRPMAAGPNTLKKKGYEFLGWSLSPDAKVPEYKEGSRLAILENTTLYAVWRKLINISIEHTEGLVANGNDLFSVSQGTKLGDLQLPKVKDGYEITGWVVNGQKVTNPKDYMLEKDSEVQVIIRKTENSDKKEPSKDNNSGNSNSGGTGNEGSSGGNSGNSSGGSSGNGGGSYSGNSMSGQSDSNSSGNSYYASGSYGNPEKEARPAPKRSGGTSVKKAQKASGQPPVNKVGQTDDTNSISDTEDAAGVSSYDEAKPPLSESTEKPWIEELKDRLPLVTLIGLVFCIIAAVCMGIRRRNLEKKVEASLKEEMDAN